jgi:hypothetical protein
MGLRARCTRLVAIAAVALASCGGGDGEDGRALLDEASNKRIESAEVRGTVTATLDGLAVLGPSTVIDVFGPVRWSRGEAVPALDWEVLVRGGGSSIPARLLSNGDDVFVEFQGRDYAGGRELLTWLFGDARPSGGGLTLERMLGASPAGWLGEPRVRDGREIGGEPTRAVSGTLDVDAAAEDLAPVFDGPSRSAIGGELRPLRELGEGDRERIAAAIRRADVTVNVDEQGYPRRVFARVRFRTPPGVRLPEGIRGGVVTVDLVLQRLGARVRVRPPRDPEPLEALARAAGAIFGIDSLSELGGPER